MQQLEPVRAVVDELQEASGLVAKPKDVRVATLLTVI